MKPVKLLPRSVTVMLCIAMIVILGAVGAAPALALDDTATGNAPLWFEFKVGKVGDDNSSNVSVMLRSQAACSGGFQVYASGPWSFWDTPSDEDWMGVAVDTGHDTYMWTGSLVPGAYYVRAGYGAQPACVPNISGQGVSDVSIVDMGWHLDEAESLPAAGPQYVLEEPTVAGADFKLVLVEQVGAASAPAAAAPQLGAASPAPVDQPDFVQVEPAMTVHQDDMEIVPGVWMPVTSDEAMIFTFHVGKASDDEPSSRVSITLYGEPLRGGQFQVFAGGGATVAQPEQDSWMGHSYTIDGEDPAWHGNLVPGVYYVRVETQGMKHHMLSVSGNAVTY